MIKSFEQECKEAAAEIERLRSLAYFQMAGETITWKEVAQSKGRHFLPLIVELADALANRKPISPDEISLKDWDAIQRAREAAKGRWSSGVAK